MPIVQNTEKSRARLQTFRRAYAEICSGESPWIPLGKFMHQFFGTLSCLRIELVQDPIELPAHPTVEQYQWAVFCAASVEYLCVKYDIVCPEWALHPHYTLPVPWYYGIGTDLPR